MADGVHGEIGREWRHAGKLARVSAMLDEAVARWIEVAAEDHQARLAATAPCRGSPIRGG